MITIHVGGGLATKSCSTLVMPQTAIIWAPPPMGFPRQEYWSGLTFPSLGDLSNPGVESRSHALQAASLRPEL